MVTYSMDKRNERKKAEEVRMSISDLSKKKKVRDLNAWRSGGSQALKTG